MFYPKKLIVPVFVCAVLAGVGLHFLYARFPCTLSAFCLPSVRACGSISRSCTGLIWRHPPSSPGGVPPGCAPGCSSLVILCPLMLVLGLLLPCGARPPRPVAGHRPCIWGLMAFGFWFPVRFSGPFRGWRWRIPAILAFLLGALILLFTFFPPAGVLFADLS